MVESAISILWFLVFVFGVLEAGRLMSVQGTLTNAAREGARYAVLPLRGTSTLPGAGAVSAEVDRYLQANAMPPGNATVTVATEVSGVTTYTAVTVTLPYRPVTLSLFSSLQITLAGRSRMRNETSR